MRSDSDYMLLALRLAKKGYGLVSPNPMVGAVIVKDGVVIGSGFHQQYGGSHAEVLAIESVRDKSLLVGSTIYVTLEPCNHYGKTPPCSKAIIDAGISRVVVGSKDPVNGGMNLLRENLVVVDTNVLSEKCDYLNRKFFHYCKTGRPFITLKIATTLDGKISDKNGDSKFITNVDARNYVYKMRVGYDAILVGANTVLHDNSNLGLHGVKALKEPLRIVMSKKVDFDQLHNGLDVFRDKNFVICSSFEDLFAICIERKISSIFVEGGAEVATQMLAHGYVNELDVFVGAKLLGNEHKPWLNSLGVEKISDAFDFRLQKAQIFDNCVLMIMVKN